MQILNFPDEDHHMHTLNFSDGIDTINAMVEYAGRIGLRVITITDHAQATLDYYRSRGFSFPHSDRWAARRYNNPFDNGVEVRFGLEADLLDETGKICDSVGEPSHYNKERDREKDKEEPLILSAHKVAYQGDPKKVTQGLIKAMAQNRARIIAVGHPDSLWDFADVMQVRDLCTAANDLAIPIEFNAKNFFHGNYDRRQLEMILTYANTIMVNSDAHSLADLNTRAKAFQYLTEKGLR